LQNLHGNADGRKNNPTHYRTAFNVLDLETMGDERGRSMGMLAIAGWPLTSDDVETIVGSQGFTFIRGM
jgi:hypothetical protein